MVQRVPDESRCLSNFASLQSSRRAARDSGRGALRPKRDEVVGLVRSPVGATAAEDRDHVVCLGLAVWGWED